MMEGIKVLTEAQQLPERADYYVKQAVLPNGNILNTPVYKEFVAVEWSDDNIWLFWDTDGRLMEIEYDSEGAYKKEVG